MVFILHHIRKWLIRLESKGLAVLNSNAESREEESRNLAFAICHVFASVLMLQTLTSQPHEARLLALIEQHVKATAFLPLLGAES